MTDENSEKQKADYKHHDLKFYYTHPIRIIFTDPEVNRLLVKRGNKGLRFSELQALLCEDPPKWLKKSCKLKRDHCHECHKLNSCKKAWSKEWQYLISKNKISMQHKKYPWKSNFSKALCELYDEEWIEYENGYYFPSEDIPENLPALIQKENILETVNSCPENDLIKDGPVHFLFVDEEFYESNTAITKEFSDFLSIWYPRLEREWYKHRLRLIAINLKYAINELKTPRAKAFLWMETVKYIDQQLQTFEKDPKDITDEVKRIRKQPRHVRKKDIKEITKESKMFKNKYGEIEQMMSKVMWGQNIPLASMAFSSLCKNNKIIISKKEQKEILKWLKEKELYAYLLEFFGLNLLHPFPSIFINPVFQT